MSTIYCMANCYHFTNSDVVDLEAYEQEVVNFISRQALQSIPFVCVDKQLKVASRDIAENTGANFIAAINSKAYKTARKQMQEGTNAILRIGMGELYGMMTSNFDPYLQIIKSPINKLTEEEQALFSASGFAFKNKAINSGMVKL